MLVALQTRHVNRELVEEHLPSLKSLLILQEQIQSLKSYNQNQQSILHFILAKESRRACSLVELNEIDLVISDDDLTPFKLEISKDFLTEKIIDRSGLILDIFALRAKTKEAKTQVELAQLEYMLPRLTRAWTHLSKTVRRNRNKRSR